MSARSAGGCRDSKDGAGDARERCNALASRASAGGRGEEREEANADMKNGIREGREEGRQVRIRGESGREKKGEGESGRDVKERGEERETKRKTREERVGGGGGECYKKKRVWEVLGQYQITPDRSHENFVSGIFPSPLFPPRVTGQFRRRHDTLIPPPAPYPCAVPQTAGYTCAVSRVH